MCFYPCSDTLELGRHQMKADSREIPKLAVACEEHYLYPLSETETVTCMSSSPPEGGSQQIEVAWHRDGRSIVQVKLGIWSLLRSTKLVRLIHFVEEKLRSPPKPHFYISRLSECDGGVVQL